MLKKAFWPVARYSIHFGFLITTLICKEKGRPRIHRLRPIHIIEAELQAITKSQWAKSLIKKAEKDNEITDSQYGGRANRQAQSAVLNKVLIFDFGSTLRKTND